jgi:hypothetical protein
LLWPENFSFSIDANLQYQRLILRSQSADSSALAKKKRPRPTTGTPADIPSNATATTLGTPALTEFVETPELTALLESIRLPPGLPLHPDFKNTLQSVFRNQAQVIKNSFIYRLILLSLFFFHYLFQI